MDDGGESFYPRRRTCQSPGRNPVCKVSWRPAENGNSLQFLTRMSKAVDIKLSNFQSVSWEGVCIIEHLNGIEINLDLSKPMFDKLCQLALCNNKTFTSEASPFANVAPHFL